ncbi:MAG: putative glutamine ABC transporter permease protein GlnM [Chloroflexi bacterium ADurb.Bin325]|nr:MAG: putative glutamine ABC transporter permease protein GlnM [Chloroflexi bacterium ADurb.Bin325]
MPPFARLAPRESRLVPVTNWLARLPYWLLAALLLALFFLFVMLSRADYRVILDATVKGVGTTVYVTIVAYALAMLAGLIIGLLRVSSNRLAREVSSFYVEIVRGVPMLVILYYIAFVGAPALAAALSWLGSTLAALTGLQEVFAPLAGIQTRDLSFTFRAILALTLGYSAFVAEIFRAGIESIGRGQMEAARSLGMGYGQAMRYVILPQAVRNVLPPLGNDFIAMLKDSSLVSVLGVQDITQIGKVYSSSTFRFFETYNVVAFLYLIMTVGLALLVRWLERRMPGRT